jgi:hypothetical protein
MEPSPSREASSCVTAQEFPNILWNTKIHFRVHKNSPTVPVLTKFNLIHATPSYLSKIHLNNIHTLASSST